MGRGEQVMEQLSFFAPGGQSAGLPRDVLEYHAGFIDQDQSDLLLKTFIQNTPWQQRLVKMYDREVLTPRLTAWYGDIEDIDYGVLGKSAPMEWTTPLLELKRWVEPIAGITFNSVLLNYYRNGNDSVAWHSDKETVMGSHPVIASVSFGAVRSFDIRKKENHREKYAVRLEHGSLLIMKGDLQARWEHRIAKTAQPIGPRVNLTFRRIINPSV
ncbi:alpha-ketoglutarate-dependent dioxygenase AlkB family protein [Pedobacter suwonensis]|uniref:alpha-ketoglutarate-dependent dioxygenase AlkB family protein n=1 Tax=Pedobacter suwonensis TaxID=332999 RepID=UPI001FD08A54|nr:alpha-ketoglutarate-dependent dioxygenase AlkB [Pedobacter suwonensis]